MNKNIGYAVSIFGIGVMAVGFGMIPVDFEFFKVLPLKYVSGAGMVLVGAGVVLALMDKNEGKKKGKGGEDEVPIYEGVGKKRRVVGYRKD